MWDMAGMWDVEWLPVNYWFLFVKRPSLSLGTTFRLEIPRISSSSEHNSAVPSLAASAAVYFDAI